SGWRGGSSCGLSVLVVVVCAGGAVGVEGAGPRSRTRQAPKGPRRLAVALPAGAVEAHLAVVVVAPGVARLRGPARHDGGPKICAYRRSTFRASARVTRSVMHAGATQPSWSQPGRTWPSGSRPWAIRKATR